MQKNRKVFMVYASKPMMTFLKTKNMYLGHFL